MSIKTLTAAAVATIFTTQASIACTLFEWNGVVLCGNPL